MTIQRSDYGCGDNSCVFGSPGGMGTNGGCRCLSEMPRHALTDRLKVQRGIMALREKIAEDAKVRAQLVEALQDLLAYAESQICSHEETHRGGAIWEICDICGDCWADDDGGKPPRQDPEEIVATRSALLAAAKVLE